MTEAQSKFVALERRKEEIKAYFDELNQAAEAVAKEVGVNGMFQADDGCVYKMIVPEGKFVYFEKYSYVRTKRAGETRGTLAAKEAKEAGFTLGE